MHFPINTLWLHGFLLGIISAPIIVLVLWLFIRLIATMYRFWHGWLKGLPVIQYPFMWLLILGTWGINGKHCLVMRHNNRVWFSPLVKRFNLKTPES